MAVSGRPRISRHGLVIVAESICGQIHSPEVSISQA